MESENKEYNEIENNNNKKIKGYMLMFNIQKQKNFGTIIRSAAAFGIDEVFLVGANHKKMTTFGSQGTANKTNYKIFD